MINPYQSWLKGCLQYKGGSNSSSSQATTSETTEASTTQTASGNGQSISVSNGGTVVTNDNAVVNSVLDFAGGVLDPIITDLNDAVAGAQQIADNALSASQSEASAASSQAASIASTAESNAQLGYSGIFENPVFIIGAVAVIGLIVWFSNRK